MRKKRSSAFSIDWLSFTLPAASWGLGDPKNVLDLLGFHQDDFESRDRGLYAYKSSAKICGGRGLMAWGGKQQRGTLHVSLPGQALAVARDTYGVPVVGLLDSVLRLDSKISRIDIAFDDLKADGGPFLAFWPMFRCLRASCVVADATKYKVIYDDVPIGEAFDSEEHGWTIYVGSRASDSYIRIYNKAAEQSKKSDAGDCDGHWIRVELEIKGKKAPEFASAWRASDYSGEYAAGILRGLLRFVVPNPRNDRTSSWQTQDWWEAFLGYVETQELGVSAQYRDADDIRAWIERQVAPSIALIHAVWGADGIDEFINDGASRWTTEHCNIIYEANIRGLDVGDGVLGVHGEVFPK
jgi:phage replication initiation protein